MDPRERQKMRLTIQSTAKRAYFRTSDAQRLENALRGLPGVEKVTRFRYDNGVDIVDLTVSAATSENLAALIEEHPSLDGFQIEVSSDSKSRIIARCRY